jgi:trehalose 6-phosphate synthase
VSRLIVVSNRISRPAGRGAAQTGGLAMALTAGLRAYNGLWFGWSGATAAEFTGEITTTRSDGVTIATIDLEEADVQEYYNGYANKTLWPVFHYRVDLAAFDRSFNEGYDRVNRRFAETLVALIKPDDIVWVHDYHLIPLARHLRQLGVKNRIGFFLHVPWPARQLVTTLPRHRQLVEALFDYDLIGFQTTEWLEAFEDYLVHEVDGEALGDGRLRAFGTTVRAGAFPIGIDAEDFAVQVRSASAMRMYDRMAAQAVFRSMIVGVDRLDYSKGLDERFLAFELFLQDNADFRGKVFLLQIAPLSRDEVDAYQDIRTRLDTLSGRINAAFADTEWSPIRYVNRNYRRDELAGVYRAARVGLVTPLRDGMNLVAKEYVAAQNPDNPGVLILSRFAGAALQMKEALIVNPYSHEEVSDALKRALSMDIGERRRRHEALFESVRRDDVTAWRESFLKALEATEEPAQPVRKRK